MKKIVIGTDGEGFDLELLLSTRLLIQANSGGGKSYLIRKLIEEVFGKVQIIVVDPEGEFSTLREKFDFVLVGSGGEAVADVRSAGLLATKLLELNASAICDIFEMKPHDRHLWVKTFIDALLDAPKKLWHPVVIIVDEAHVFAPEKGSGDSIALGAMTDLATRGRKRGYCSVFATQRLAKLSKNVSAELQNVMIGSTVMDIDRERAADALGILKASKIEFFENIRTLAPGQFYAMGRAISQERIVLQVAGVRTSHPESGTKMKSGPPPTPAKIKAMLPQLADLPQAAEQKAKTESDLRKEIAELKRQILTIDQMNKRVSNTNAELVPFKIKLAFAKETIQEVNKKMKRTQTVVNDFFMNEMVTFDQAIEFINQLDIDGHHRSEVFKIPSVVRDGTKPSIKSKFPVLNEQNADVPVVFSSKQNLPEGERKILTVIAQQPNCDRDFISVMTSFKKSSRDAYIQRLKTKGLVDQEGLFLFPTKDGLNQLGPFEPLPVGSELQQYWKGKLPIGEWKILEQAIEAYPHFVDRFIFDQKTGFKKSSRDAYIQRLSQRKLVVTERGSVRASGNLFDR